MPSQYWCPHQVLKATGAPVVLYWRLSDLCILTRKYEFGQSVPGRKEYRILRNDVFITLIVWWIFHIEVQISEGENCKSPAPFEWQEFSSMHPKFHFLWEDKHFHVVGFLHWKLIWHLRKRLARKLLIIQMIFSNHETSQPQNNRLQH